ncbi:alpha/beta hydrolase [Acrocarpospora corrugata]|uniref:Alpha/beta hydrolase n=1 Tax=Acrocarpospora corrugata TaxID=35763 RepID=A0A5M3W4J2_9ACTN|nr:alpha/beta hydrolase [Acrocarpospora corrugata]GES01468.1 alpha/beta hydrolase [Acrocarpospora corrugata]
MAVEIWGKPDGTPVFLLHGTPGGRFQPRPREKSLHMLGIRLISFDRPGYGGSARRLNRTVGDVAADVAAIADALGLGVFAVVGRSGGAPHALACAALLPDRVTRAAALVGLAPRTAEGLDWFEGMIDANVMAYTEARAGHRAITARLRVAAREIRADPGSKVRGIYEQVPESDRRVVGDNGIRRMLERNFVEGLRDSVDGWVDDVMAFSIGWGFEVSAITAPTLLWHGENDVYSPVGHAYWLAGRIPHADVWIQRGAAHFGALEVLPRVLAWLVRGSGEVRSAAAPSPG